MKVAELYLVYKITYFDEDQGNEWIEDIKIYDRLYDDVYVAYSDSIIRKYYNKRNAWVEDPKSTEHCLENDIICQVAEREFKEVNEETTMYDTITEKVYIKKLDVISV